MLIFTTVSFLSLTFLFFFVWVLLLFCFGCRSFLNTEWRQLNYSETEAHGTGNMIRNQLVASGCLHSDSMAIT